MKAMILAAGRGERMRPLSDRTPKPLLAAGGRALIARLIEGLAAAGLRELVINLAWQAEAIEAALGAGEGLGVRIRYSREPPGALDTGGGIRHALPMLGAAPFVVVNGDIWTEFPFAALPAAPAGLAHLVLVDNPAHRPQGDFALQAGRVAAAGGRRLTFAGIGVYRPELFADTTAARFPLAPLLRAAAARGEVTGEHYRGGWLDVGTPQRLQALEARLRGAPGR